MEKREIQLKWKVFAFLIGFCALMLIVLWLFQTVFLNDMYKLIRKSEMRQAILRVERNIESDDLQALFDEIRQTQDILITPSDDFVPIFKQPRQGEQDRPRQETLTQTRELTMADGEVLSLTFHALITPVGATVSTLKIQLYIITVIMIAFSVLLALVIAARVSKPIEKINKSAKQLSNGNYDVRFDEGGFLEISELSRTLNAAASELSKVEGLRRELMSNISHDLRTPLSLIYSYAEMMQDFPGEVSAEQTKVIMDETSRLSSLVNDAFEISKLQSGVQALNKAVFNLTEVIEATLERMAELLKKEGYSFAFEYDGDVKINADRVKIEQVFYNLLINAINYSLNDKYITVRQSMGEHGVKIEVKDRGDGISPEQLPYIWDRYYKADKNHKRAVTGTGLGLSIVKKMVELHDGSYGVSSSEGEGSCFWFELPV